jgi:pimeloyl-ACP methyl ester carboxylesterase
MSAIRLGDDLIHYEVLGRGRPVILLHSWVGSWRYWIPTMQQLGLKYRVYALDLYGYGDSVKNAQKYTLEHQIQLLDDFTQQLGIPKTALVGHGLGAMVVIEFARRYNDRVPRMLVSGAPLFDPGNLEQRSTIMPQVLAASARPVPTPTSADEKHAPEPTVMNASSAMRAALAEAARNRTTGTEAPRPVTTIEPPSPSRNGDNPLQAAVGSATPETLLAKCFKKSEPEFEKLQADVAKTDTNAVKFSVTTFDSGYMLDTLRYHLPMPIVVVHGADDPVIPMPSENVWNYLTTDKEDTLLPVLLNGIRHFPMLESERFARLVTDFLESQDVSKLEIKERWKRRTR